MRADVEDWLEARLDDVPDEFLPWLDPPEGRSEDALAEELTRRGIGALADAADRPGRDREAAFRLLAADAYLTWACEAILEGPEPDEGLRTIMRRISAESE